MADRRTKAQLLEALEQAQSAGGGTSYDRLMADLAGAGTGALAGYDDLVKRFYAKGPFQASRAGLIRDAKSVGGFFGDAGRKGAQRMAVSALRAPGMGVVAKLLPGIGAATGVAAAGDILLGGDSMANKAMDTLGMGIGAAVGAAGGPLGIAAGAGVGKNISDGLQYLFGDRRSAEEKQLEQALIALRGGQL